jgi:hypothetical protein
VDKKGAYHLIFAEEAEQNSAFDFLPISDV